VGPFQQGCLPESSAKGWRNLELQLPAVPELFFVLWQLEEKERLTHSARGAPTTDPYQHCYMKNSIAFFPIGCFFHACPPKPPLLR